MEERYVFRDRERAVEITTPVLPTPWINYLSNGSLHAFVSQAGGGLLWWKHPAVFRLTRYRQYNLPIDSPGFYVYIREKSGTVWSPSFRPTETDVENFSAVHQPGKSTFRAENGGISAELRLFICPDVDAMVWDLTLTNSTRRPVSLDLFGYVELSLQQWLLEVTFGYYFKHQLKTWFDKELQSLLYLYHLDFHPRLREVPLLYFACSQRPKGFDGDRDRFIGNYRTERNPEAVEKGSCGNSELMGGEPCAALQTAVKLAPKASKNVRFYLGIAPNALANFRSARAQVRRDLKKLRSAGVVEDQMRHLDRWWDDHLDRFRCSIPDPDTQRQINTWNPVQSVHCGRYSRSISFHASGQRGVGFRDTCQDMLAIAYRKPDWAREMLIYQLTQQFEDGHAVHSSFPEQRELPEVNGIRSDEHLWLPMLAHAILSETGDLSLLQEKVPYLAEDLVSRGPASSIWEHLCRAIDFSQKHLGTHGLTLSLKGDWNDIIGKFSLKGKGESVFAAQQYVYVLRLMEEMAHAIGDAAAGRRFASYREQQISALNKWAWDGAWWRRGFDDDGVAFGSKQAKWGRIFLNTQSWAIISGVTSLQQAKRAFASVEKHLATPVGLKLCAPGFKTFPDVAEPFSGYNVGCGENGAVFCHANAWAIMAMALVGNAEKAWEYYRHLIPHLALKKVGLQRYQAEPYAYVSNILGPENIRYGYANVGQVTGTAAWMDVVATQYLLGIRPELGGLRIDPCIPAQWRSFSVSRLYRGCRLAISVSNPGGVVKGVRSIEVDGKVLDSCPVILAEELRKKKAATVKVTMGR